MGEAVKKFDQNNPESYHPHGPEIIYMIEEAARNPFTSAEQNEKYPNVRLVEKAEWLLAGRRGIMEEDIWGQCRNEEGFFQRMQDIALEKPGKNLAYCIGGGEPGKSPWLIGVETTAKELDGLDTLTIPATKWLVFSSYGPMNPNFFAMQGQAYDVYFEDPNREFDWHHGMRSFEKYCTEDVNGEDTLIELWCPVTER